MYERKWLILNNSTVSSNWRLHRGSRFEIISMLGDIYLVWANGSCVAIDMRLNQDYEIESEIVVYDQ